MELAGKRALVTGGSRGLGLALVEALHARGARVTVLARDAERLSTLRHRLGVDVIAGDVTDEALARSALRDVRPSLLILNAGTTPPMGPLHELSWEDFSTSWNSDTKAALYWIQQAIRLPLAPGTRVLLGGSGAAVSGSPLSGGHAGAKRMIWLLAHYANALSDKLGLGLRFQVVVPLQIIGETDHGRSVAGAYARSKGVSLEAMLSNFGKPLPPAQFAQHVITLLTDPAYDHITAVGLKGDSGMTTLDG